MGVTSSKIREKKLTLDKAIGIAQSFEYAQAQLRFMGEPTNQASVNEVQPRRRGQQAKKAERHTQKGTPSDKRSQRNVTDVDHTTNNRTNALQRESNASNAKSIITLHSSAEQLTTCWKSKRTVIVIP